MPFIGAGMSGGVFGSAEDPWIKPLTPVLNESDPLAASLIAAWLFSEGSGSSIEDHSTRTNALTLQNAEAGDWVQDAVGWRVDFDGVGEYARSANDIFTNADIASGSVFLVCSVPAGATINRVLFSCEAFVQMTLRAGGVIGGFTDGSGTDKVLGGTAINTGTPVTIGLSWATNQRINLYINGVADSAQGTPAAAPNVDALAGRATAIAASFSGTSLMLMGCYSALVFGSELQAADFAALHASPWAMFR